MKSEKALADQLFAPAALAKPAAIAWRRSNQKREGCVRLPIAGASLARLKFFKGPRQRLRGLFRAGPK
jgi:hypothetical protein